jgi:hypothetical protein
MEERQPVRGRKETPMAMVKISGRITLLILCALTTSTCVAPIPSSDHEVIAGTAVTPTVLESFTPGVTTKTEVLAKLGTPYTALEAPPVLVYPWSTRWGIAPWLLVYPVGAVGGVLDIPEHHVLLVALDGQDRVQLAGLSERSPVDSLREHALTWAEKHGLCGERQPTPFAPRAIPPGQAVLYVYRVGSFVDLTNAFVAAIVWQGGLLTELRRNEYAALVLPPGSHTVVVSPDAKNPSSQYARKVASLAVQLQPEQATFLRVSIPQGGGNVTPRLMLPAPEEALKELSGLTAAW